jgi:hypothetical protein
MIARLTCGFVVLEQDIKTVEEVLIAEVRPPLNLIGWSIRREQICTP